MILEITNKLTGEIQEYRIKYFNYESGKEFKFITQRNKRMRLKHNQFEILLTNKVDKYGDFKSY